MPPDPRRNPDSRRLAARKGNTGQAGGDRDEALGPAAEEGGRDSTAGSNRSYRNNRARRWSEGVGPVSAGA